MFFISTLASLMCLTVRVLSSEQECSPVPLEGMDVYNKHPNEYLVMFHKGHTLEQHFHHIGRNLSSSPHFRRYTFGYQATMDDETRDKRVRCDPGVHIVETNRPAFGIKSDNVLVLDPLNYPHNQTARPSKRNYWTNIQEDAPWGLQMITTPSKRLDIPILDGGSYEYLAGAGLGVQVYVMDGGIRTTHKLFGGRARHFGGLKDNDMSPYTDATMADFDGHGTHVAGIIGAEMYGVAPHVNLVNVKVLNNQGKIRDFGDISQALTDITAEHNKNKATAKTDPNPWNFRGSVINMSLTWVGRGEVALYQLIAANDAGISVFAAAGNQNEGYGDRYPCANVQTRCIAAVDATYNKRKNSNYGRTVDFVAPGENILSLHSTNDIAIAKRSGTSAATPHAAGAAAIFTSWKGLETHYDLSQNLVYWNSISGVVSGFSSGTTTFLINTGIHSSKKNSDEPFRYGEKGPHKPQAVDDPSSSVVDAWVQSAPPSDPSDALMTTVYTDMATATLAPIGGLSTLSDMFSDDTDAGPTSSASVLANPTSGPTAVPSCASSGTTFTQPAAQKFISTFCAQSFLDAQFVPYVAIGNTTDQFGQPKSTNAEGHFTFDGTSNVIWFRTRFTHNACTGSFNGTYQCAERFSTILNGCQTDTITAKLGGTLSIACAEYDLTVVGANTNPFNVDDDSAVGDFTCKDTSAPMTDLYPDTCTCWMSERADQTAVFVKPADGVCEGKSVDQINGLAPGQGY